MINNGVHDSVGGQKINSKNLDYKKISKGFGYDLYFKSTSLSKLEKAIKISLKKKKCFY